MAEIPAAAFTDCSVADTLPRTNCTCANTCVTIVGPAALDFRDVIRFFHGFDLGLTFGISLANITANPWTWTDATFYMRLNFQKGKLKIGSNYNPNSFWYSKRISVSLILFNRSSHWPTAEEKKMEVPNWEVHLLTAIYKVNRLMSAEIIEAVLAPMNHGRPRTVFR